MLNNLSASTRLVLLVVFICIGMLLVGGCDGDSGDSSGNRPPDGVGADAGSGGDAAVEVDCGAPPVVEIPACAPENVCAADSSCVDGLCEDGCCVPVVCRAPLVKCGEEGGVSVCVNLDYDLFNCGSCGVVCGEERFCRNGACIGPCEAMGFISCGEECVNPADNQHHCGACDTNCQLHEVCRYGVCESTCDGALGQVGCDGVCVDVAVDDGNCGECGRACPQGTTCVEGRCRMSGAELTCCNVDRGRVEATTLLLQAVGQLSAVDGQQLVALARSLHGEEVVDVDSGCCAAQVERMVMVGRLFKSVARNPENSPIMGQIVEDYLRVLGEEQELCCEAQVARMAAVSTLFESTARQPEAALILTEYAQDYLGVVGEEQELCCEAQVARMAAAGTLFESTARQPEAAPILTEYAQDYLGVVGEQQDLCCNAQVARMAVVGSLFETIARQPEAGNLLNGQAVVSLGVAVAHPDNNGSCLMVESARMDLVVALTNALLRQPQAHGLLTEALVAFGGVPSDNLSCEGLGKRTRAVVSILTAIHLLPNIEDDVSTRLPEIVGSGPAPEELEPLCPYAQGEYHAAMGHLYHLWARYANEAQDLALVIEHVEQYLPPISPICLP